MADKSQANRMLLEDYYFLFYDTEISNLFGNLSETELIEELNFKVLVI
jgi:hypothetical protein